MIEVEKQIIKELESALLQCQVYTSLWAAQENSVHAKSSALDALTVLQKLKEYRENLNEKND